MANFIDEPLFYRGILPGAVDIGVAIAQAFQNREKRDQKRLSTLTTQALQAGASEEATPEITSRTTKNALGESVSVQDVRLPADISGQLDERLLGPEKMAELQKLQDQVSSATSDGKRRKAEAALKQFQLAQRQPLASGRADQAPGLSVMSQLAQDKGAPQSSQASAALLTQAMSAPPEFQDRIRSMLPELQDEAQAEKDRGRIQQLMQAKQLAEQQGDQGRVAQIDLALSEYAGALDDATVGQQIMGGLPEGHPKAFDVHPMFGGNGLVQAVEQQQFRAQPLEAQYQTVLQEAGIEATRSAPTAMERSTFEQLAGGLGGTEYIDALEMFAREREAGGNVFTATDVHFGAEKGRSARNGVATALVSREKKPASASKQFFRFRPNDGMSNSWGVYNQVGDAAQRSGLNPAQADFVGALAMHSAHATTIFRDPADPRKRDAGSLHRLAKVAHNAPAAKAIMDEQGLSPAEQRFVMGLASAYGLEAQESAALAEQEAQAAKPKAQRTREDEAAAQLIREIRGAQVRMDLQRRVLASPQEDQSNLVFEGMSPPPMLQAPPPAGAGPAIPMSQLQGFSADGTPVVGR